MKLLVEDNPVEVFEFVKARLLEQKVPSISGPRGNCMLRGPGGLKCAVGHIIPDEAYEDNWEINSAVGAYDTEEENFFTPVNNFLGKYYPNSLRILGSLQRLHDRKFSNDIFRPEDFNEVAKNYGIKE